MARKLPRSFYLRPTLTVARDLLGKHLIRRIGRRRLVGMIIEVEAYLGARDPASHAYRGKTRRNEVMFRKGGHLYVYFTYGMHFCANVVTRGEGVGEAVLLRAVEPLAGMDTMRSNRGLSTGTVQPRLLTGGPARICEAFRITRRENGSDLTGEEIFIATGNTVPPSEIVRTTRIGITRARDKRWRFALRNNEYVSR